MSDRPSVTRCAIYTRKSSEEGLDQAFNSLHAQREACEAYVLSQAGEGWMALPTPYDDGGFSGGNLDRPALKRLLADITAGKVDTVVVYKIDRLTRSLGDFAKIVDRLDAANASFVSVTQAFNTTTSMGRLTLNVLLSFAQFEREVTGERIRDKLAASKAKGMWMGGCVPLGYDPPTDLVTRALVVNSAESETVRLIFCRYLELSSVSALERWLALEGYRSKRHVSRRGRESGGVQFSRGALFHLLKNRLYLGEIPHKDKVHPGAHQAIVDRELFDAVQARLVGAVATHKARKTQVGAALLKGMIFDADGHPMCPAYARGRGEQPYRYYVSAPLTQGRPVAPDAGAIRRIPAGPIEEVVLDRVRRVARLQGAASALEIREIARRVEVHAGSLHIVLDADALHPGRSIEVVLEQIEGRLVAQERAYADHGHDRQIRVAPSPPQLGGRCRSERPRTPQIMNSSGRRCCCAGNLKESMHGL